MKIEDKQENLVKNWWNNVKNTKKNYQKVRSSPYASLVFALRIRKMILIPLIIFIIWKGYDMIINYHASGFMNTVGKIIMIAIFAYLIYRIYSTIPAAKKQLKYYQKYPHVINYCPTNVKEDIDDILNKIKENQNKLNLKEAENVSKKEENSNGKRKKSSGSSTKRD